jgi:iron complex transport system ATP-binding protein
MKDDRVIDINDLSIGYKKKGKANKIFSAINLQAFHGELIALVGLNGIGKSTLLRTIAGLQKKISGSIFLSGTILDELPKYQLAKQLSVVTTENISINNLTVYDLIALGRYPHTSWFGSLKQTDINKIEEAIRLLRLDTFRFKHVLELSDGERQRVMIARALAQDTEIIILDEPTAFLDLSNKYEIVHILSNLAHHHNKTIIFSSHDLNIIIREADKIWLMKENQIFEGAPEDLIISDTFSTIFNQDIIQFDRLTGDFKSVHTKTNEVFLSGNGEINEVTFKALERLGLSISDNEMTKYKILIREVDNKPVWELITDSTSQKHFNIYSLMRQLRELFKNDAQKNIS